MAQTHPNAYRAEAAEKRIQAAQLANEAESLEAQADELEGKTPKALETELPEGGETFDPEQENQQEEKPSKIPFKK